MSIAEFKRSHWALVGLALGLLISLWLRWLGPEATLLDRPTLEAIDFERLILQKSPDGQPLVRDIRVHSRIGETYWLTAEQLFGANRPRGGAEYVGVKIPAKIPFVPQKDRPANVDPNHTIVDWLRAMKGKHPEIAFSTRWWAHEPVRSPLLALCGMLLLAGICPKLMHAIYGAGAGAGAGDDADAEAKQKQKAYDLSRFGKGGPAPEPPKPGPKITEADLAHVRELDEELERRLAARIDAETAAAAAAAPDPAVAGTQDNAAPATPASSGPAQPSPQVRKLDAGPLDAHVDDAPKKTKRFGGEYYPTETHAKQEDT